MIEWYSDVIMPFVFGAWLGYWLGDLGLDLDNPKYYVILIVTTVLFVMK